jgi:hypothetical protein
MHNWLSRCRSRLFWAPATRVNPSRINHPFLGRCLLAYPELLARDVSTPRSRSTQTATPQVSNIAQSILSELDRARGTTISLTLDIAAVAVDGFSEDVETIVRHNATSLRIADFGFEEE